MFLKKNKKVLQDTHVPKGRWGRVHNSRGMGQTQISIHRSLMRKIWYRCTMEHDLARNVQKKRSLAARCVEQEMTALKPGGHTEKDKYHVCISAAAAAKSLQSCLTLCDPIDGSPPGSPVPGFLQARTLEWVAISSSNARK